ncbi:XRE family transcriptional regulator [Streptomyces longisporoflavus]|uniref:XRE family transcriptional regulator n=1 Tax=Streptomyces longisporoflavus TaxID=28044 RepID=A0ABW7QSD5_9ACTN
MRDPGELSPYEARDAAGFIQLMRKLKERSGLTYRELEERAARNGDVLARSTLADVLRRTSLPRPDVLAAFVRACGDGQDVASWLDARGRIASEGAAAAPASAAATADTADETSVAAPGPEAGVQGGQGVQGVQGVPRQSDETAGARSRRLKSRTALLAAFLIVPLLALGAWALIPDSSGDSGTPAAAATTSVPLDGGWVTIRPAGTPDLCLTDGRDRDGAYDSAVAVQLPCAQAPVPRVYLEPAGEGFYRIQWHHPQHGKGCLAIMGSGPVKGMLEPRQKCGQATLFRVEAATTEGAEKVRLHPSPGNRCIGIAGNDTSAGAEAIAERCTGAPDQQFRIKKG